MFLSLYVNIKKYYKRSENSNINSAAFSASKLSKVLSSLMSVSMYN